jgi:electron transport complex protein RnfA
MSALEIAGSLGALAVFSGLSLNLLLQFGLGIGGIMELVDGDTREKQWVSHSSPYWLILFISPFVLWLFFTYVLPAPAFGFLESFLFFPAAMLVSAALELVFSQIKRRSFNLRELAGGIGADSGGLFRYSGNGMAMASLFLTLRLAVSVVDALVLCLGFSLGSLGAALILREINKRSSLESVPLTFRGAPLSLISMGRLSLIFSSGSTILLRVLGVFK